MVVSVAAAPFVAGVGAAGLASAGFSSGFWLFLPFRRPLSLALRSERAFGAISGGKY